MSESTPAPDTASDAEVLTVSDGAYTLIVADFAALDDALAAYESLKEAEDGATLKVEGVVVVRRTEDGKLEVQKATDHSTRRGLTWGAVGGAVLGVLFPPSILASAAVLGAGGAAVGGLRQRHHRKELEEQLATAVAPGHSGLVALVSDPGAVKIRKALARAQWIVQSAVDESVARDLEAAARDDEHTARSAGGTAPSAES
ncbi:MAG TPA: DUF1269 domain-containing protein [Kineosporiaceae bacterium]|nr:DUF1269 domain-containing protein [Kineosporiaceae bacterium]